jgi:quinol monooxygenase YgiN
MHSSITKTGLIIFTTTTVMNSLTIHSSDIRYTPGPCDTIKVIEIRNYLIRHGQRDSFIDFFQSNFIQSQQDAGACLFGQYRVKDQDDNFLWIRGFASMEARSKFLPSFYYGDFWNRHKEKANSFLANNDNVHLLRPLTLDSRKLSTASGISHENLAPSGGLVVLDYYISNSKLDKLITFFEQHFIEAINKSGVKEYTLWVSELEENDFPRLPVFQDKNLMVMVSSYKDEAEYRATLMKIRSLLTDEMKYEMTDIVTQKTSLLVYPAKSK